MAGPPNLHILHPDGASDIAAAVEKLKREMQQIREYNQQMAKVIRSEFDSYVAEGFTAAQALQLVKAKLTPPAK
ncbi:hypothetical protein [Luteimonas fraxinea]|uniref:Uncharacterized protein n=1 Tax=Luteimonas fraxinea TaxID=2901869 RepID=A0ABS8UBT7_9GAMM|nr:hypothetical protein [Luteimonas fraxinea]MCD9096196.1 hypothetical protein [Luteimonas fraxinea]